MKINQIKEEVFPQCHNCGGNLRIVERVPISKYDSSLPESMCGKKYLFSGYQCQDCEYRQLESFLIVKA